MIVIKRYTTEFNSNLDLSPYNLSELAKRIGCSRSYLSKVRSGKIKIDEKYYNKLCEILDFPIFRKA